MGGADYQGQLESWAKEILGAKGNGTWRNCRCLFHDDAVASGRFNVENAKFVCQACGKQCFADQMAAELGLAEPPVKPEWAEKQRRRKDSQPYIDRDGFQQVDTYFYRNAAGKVCLRVFRMEKPSDDGKKRKKFPQSWPAGDGWVFKQPDGFEWVLYGLPELLASTDPVVLIVEGEKDVLRARREGFTATTTPMGAGQNAGKAAMVRDWSALRGKTVVPIPDNDAVGSAHALEVARLASSKGSAGSVKVVALPGLGDGGDLSDWFDAGGTADQLRELIRETPALYARPERAPEEPGPAVFEWGTPTPLQVTPPPDFDLSIFHPSLADFAQALADETETPTSFAGNLLLGLLGAIMAGGFVIRVKGGWFEEAFAWTITVGLPGEGKSPVMRPIILPLRAAERRWRDSALPRISKEQAGHDYQGLVLKKALDELKKEPEDEMLRRACDREREKLETLKVSTPPQLLFNDSTMEAVFRQAMENHGIGAYISDEIGFLQRQQGAGAAGDSNIDLLLHGYDGQPYRNRRIKSGQSDIDAARIIICAMAQPGPFGKFVNDDHLREKGFPDRALISWPPSLMGSKTFDKPAVSRELRERFESFVDDLLIRYKGVDGNRKPAGVVVSLSDEARRKVIEFRRKMDRMAGEGGRYHAISGYVSKMAGKAVRLAALFYGSENVPGSIDLLPAECIDRAIYLIESHYLPHAARAFGIEPEEVDTVNARAIISKLIKSGAPSEPRDRIRRLTRLGPDSLDAALDLLEGYGWLRAEEIGTRGRPKVVYHVHPDAGRHFGLGVEQEPSAPPPRPDKRPTACVPVPSPAASLLSRESWDEQQASSLEGLEVPL